MVDVTRETFAYYLAEAEDGLCKIPRRVADDMALGYASLQKQLAERTAERDEACEAAEARADALARKVEGLETALAFADEQAKKLEALLEPHIKWDAPLPPHKEEED